MPSATLSYAGRSATLNWADGDSLSQQDVDAAQDHLQNVANADTLANNARYGAGNAVSGLGSAAQVVGDAASNVGLTGTGAALNSAGGAIKSVGQAIAPNDPNFQPTTGGSLVGDVEGGRYGQAAHDVGDLVAQAAPYAGAALATGGTGGAVLGGLSAAGNAAQAHAAPGANATVSDALHPDVAVQGLGGLAMGRLVGGKVPMGVLGRIGTDAAVNSGTSVATNLANGQAPNWSDALGAGIQGAGSGGLAAGRDLVGQGARLGVTRGLQAGMDPFENTTQAQGAVDAQKAVQAIQAARPGTGDLEATNSAKAGLAADLTNQIRAMPNGPDRVNAMADLRTAINNKATVDLTGMDPSDPTTQKLAALDALSGAQFRNQQTGPFQKVLGKAGRLAMTGAGAGLGEIATGGMSGGLLGAGVGHTMGAAGGYVGDKIGAGIDRFAGLQQSPIDLRADMAGRYLAQMASAPVTPVSQPLQAPPAAPSQPPVGQPTPQPQAPQAAPQAPQMAPPPAAPQAAPQAPQMAVPNYIASQHPPGAVSWDMLHDAADKSGVMGLGALTRQWQASGKPVSIQPQYGQILNNAIAAKLASPGTDAQTGGVKGTSENASGVRNQAAYNANLAQEADAYKTAAAFNPQAADALRDRSLTGGTKAGRLQVAQMIISRLPPSQQNAASAALLPLASYGVGPQGQ